jgi:hypothetical protein
MWYYFIGFFSRGRTNGGPVYHVQRVSTIIVISFSFDFRSLITFGRFRSQKRAARIQSDDRGRPKPRGVSLLSAKGAPIDTVAQYAYYVP